MAVGGGVLTTCNYKAREFGVRSGMVGYIAKRRHYSPKFYNAWHPDLFKSSARSWFAYPRVFTSILQRPKRFARF